MLSLVLARLADIWRRAPWTLHGTPRLYHQGVWIPIGINVFNTSALQHSTTSNHMKIIKVVNYSLPYPLSKCVEAEALGAWRGWSKREGKERSSRVFISTARPALLHPLSSNPSQSGRQAGRQAIGWATKQVEREANSQPVSQSVRKAVGRASKQADRQVETHSLAFFRSRTTSTNSGEPLFHQSNWWVRHPISCLRVCYANDPQKGGCTSPWRLI